MTMPICRTCNGKGTCRVNYLNDRMIDIKCIDCKGTGEYPPLLTNEEWFCGLSTEEKANVIMNIRNLAVYKEQIVEWLKDKHTE